MTNKFYTGALTAIAGLIALFSTHFIWIERIALLDKLGPSDLDNPSYIFSKDWMHFAFCVLGEKDYVVIDGQKGPLVDSLMRGFPIFSDLGDVCYYVGNIGKYAVLFKNNKAIYKNKKINGTIYIGKYGNHFFYIYKYKGNDIITFDGQEEGFFDKIIYKDFLGSSEIPTFIGEKDNLYYLVHGVRRYGPYKGVRLFTCDSSGNTIAFSAQDNRGAFVQIGENRIPGISSVQDIQLDQYGNHFSIIAENKNKINIISDNIRMTSQFDFVVKNGYLPNGTEYYLARSGTCGSAFLGATRSACYQSIGCLMPMLDKIAYIGNSGDESFVGILSPDGETRFGPFPHIDFKKNYFFSDKDKTRLFFTYYKSGGIFVVVDGKTWGPFDNLDNANFTSDKKAIFSVKHEGYLEIYINGKKWKKVKDADAVGSGAKGHIFSYIENREMKRERIWMDGWTGHSFDRILRYSIFSCDSWGGISYLAYDNHRLYRSKFQRLDKVLIDLFKVGFLRLIRNR